MSATRGLDRAVVVPLGLREGPKRAAAILGCGEATVRYHLRRASVPPLRPGRPRRALDPVVLRRMARQGFNTQQIRRALGVSMTRALEALRTLRAEAETEVNR